MKITRRDINDARTAKGGFTKNQMRVANKITGGKKLKGWASRLVGSTVTEGQWLEFLNARGGKAPKKSSIINKVSGNSGEDWSWKPESGDIPGIKVKGKPAGKRKSKREKISRLDSNEFYNSREWKELRVRVLEKYECKCMMCGESPKVHGIVIHVDHIKPRSKYRHLSLVFENLQLLCENCNLGKSNKYETDWRPDLEQEQIEHDMALLESSPL